MKLFSRLKNDLALQIFLAMVLAVLFGLIVKLLPDSLNRPILNILDTGGQIFLNFMKMIIVPVVFVSLVTGVCSLKNNISKLGKLSVKSILFFIIMTAFAVFVGVFFASIFNIGAHSHFTIPTATTSAQHFSLKEMLINLVPGNPMQALVEGNILQIITFAIIFGLAINFSGNSGTKIASIFEDLNAVIMKMVMLLMKLAPYGVFCLIASLFDKFGTDLIKQLFEYISLVIIVLILYSAFTYSLLLKLLAKLNPITFFRKMYGVLIFAFSIASSNATLPLLLETAEKKLGVSNTIASFVIPLGTNMNKNGTALVQGVAAIFIANVYQIQLTLASKFLIVITATLASIGTAGAPSIGIFALAMVLKQVGLPIEGIGLIIGIDRIIDMIRTAVNVAGNATLSCIIGKSEKGLDRSIYSKN